ncbi:MAG: alpha/beta hydrolase [Algoriphagus sp.]|uniref:alpha/beta hydrolase n=1 Tax=Algoriphagus sp. TaxID=1872435 RepID=UPI0026150DAF|nr:alpha/beta hydrolase [Algoriphagus sp.]MDG1279596.1 alpha/beta hydrolase [Algoriphagus sp.]
MKKQIRFEYEAQYAVSHEPNFQEKEIWVVLHGYGQLAEFFIRKFQAFDSPDRLFIAPEGTNYQYLNGFSGRVGANWMTRHERERAIANNHRFLDSLLQDLLSKFKTLPKINVLGFSQGAATATRWASNWEGNIDRLVLWAGGFATDLILEDARVKFLNTEINLALGEKDELISPESIEIQEELIRDLGKVVHRHFFSGGHELDQELLKKIID